MTAQIKPEEIACFEFNKGKPNGLNAYRKAYLGALQHRGLV